MNVRYNKRVKGFTMMEMLIVIAIIAVLVAISIPTFSGALEKSREAADLAAIRSAYSEISMKFMTENEAEPITLNLQQKVAGWKTENAQSALNGITDNHVTGVPADGSNSAIVEWLSDERCVKITFSGETINAGSEEGNVSALGLKGTFMEQAAKGLQKGFEELIPKENLAQADSCLHTDKYTAYNGDLVVVKELSITKKNLENGVYWNPQKHTWGELLAEAGVDLTGAEDADGYVYLDDQYNPVSVSYYDEDGNYCYTYFKSGETYTLSKMPGERQHAGYYEEYAESLSEK